VDTPVLYEDADLVAVAKPSGLPTIPARDEPPAACLHKQLEATRGERLWIVHRIDRDTSGVVVFARTAAAHRALSMAFEHRRVRKAYAAFAVSAPGRLAERGRIDVALHPARKGKTRPALPGEAGQAAVTDYAVERRWTRGGVEVALVEARPETGRHHQIRVHLRSLDAPILGDPLYGKHTLEGPLAKSPCRRLALHARRLTLPAPAGERTIEAPWPDDLRALVAWLDGGDDGATAGGGATAGAGPGGPP
jgi:tRNA pseudouridine32 synthase/23S rRNA pseudouridine746 synthase